MTRRPTAKGLPSTVRQRFGQAWLQIDPSAMGLFRIVFGLLCIYDVARRFQWIETFYSNTGTLSNHYNLFSPLFRDNISLLSGFSTPAEVTGFFVFTLISLFFFTIGYRTKLFQIISWLCVLSIHSRNTMLANGGDVVMNIWWIWTIWLPLGQRLSIDSIRSSLRNSTDLNPGQLFGPIASETKPIRSLVMFMVLWQLAIIYFFNTVHKGGSTWADGTSIAYCLEQDRIVTRLGLWAKATWPLWISQILTWGTLVIEGIAPLLLLTPFKVLWARRIAIILLVGLHTGIWLLTDVGLFSPTMMVSFFLLLRREDIELAKDILRKLSGQKIRVWYDDHCGICFRLARLGSRLDRLGLIEWHGSRGSAVRPHSMSSDRFDALREDALITESVDGRGHEIGHRAIGRIINALPLGRLISWPLFLPGLTQLMGLMYAAFASRRHRVSAALGYGECGLPIMLDSPGPQARVISSISTIRTIVATSLIVLLFAATTSQMLHENRFMKVQVLKKTFGINYKQPTGLKKIVSYARIFQGWSMFAPNAPVKDGWLVIDAVRMDGSHVDPQTNRIPDFGPADARKMQWDQFWGSYSMRIASGRHKRYRGELISWLKNSKIDRLKLKAGERIKSVTVWWVGDRSPDPKVGGEPTLEEKYIVAEWPAKKVD
ncbi:MAG: DCC1-like thiol-disulfide oxidoreductase family protein [Myxococcota bacterium]|nr:DCC1-like thiol-disulfide oxidoreductase family protein [Myxococcota bacterium]